jgi:cytochrome c oxidase cbb3-type subunit 3
MSSRCRNKLGALLLAALALAGCDREERHNRPKPLGEQVPETPQQLREQLRYYASYERNAQHIAEGHRLFVWMNCVGCHANGGGGMGPPLMDEEWRYGGRIDQIAATIVEGRPNGMPSFEGKITADQVWQLAAYVRSLSGQTRKDAVPGRVDAMSSTPPASEMVEEPVVPENFSDQ